MTFVTPEAIGVAGAEDPKLQSVAKCAHTHTHTAFIIIYRRATVRVS